MIFDEVHRLRGLRPPQSGPAGRTPDQEVDLSAILQRLIAQRQLLAYQPHQRFYGVGSPVGLKGFEALGRSVKLQQLNSFRE